MTYKEEVLRRHPDSIRVDCFGGILGCPGEYFLGAPESGNCGNRPIIEEENCEKCWNTEIPVATNADRIRAKSDEELEELFWDIYNAGSDDAEAWHFGDGHRYSFEWDLEWLQKPVEEEA